MSERQFLLNPPPTASEGGELPSLFNPVPGRIGILAEDFPERVDENLHTSHWFKGELYESAS